MVLKGWAYIQTLYAGDHGQRFCEDIDLLIRPQDVDDVEQILSAAGFAGSLESWPGYSRKYLNARAYTFAARAGKSDGSFTIGLHWGLFGTPYYDPAQVDIAALMNCGLPLHINEVQVLQAGPEDQLVYACAHLGLHHDYDESFFRYYEIARSISAAAPAIDWAAVQQRARDWRCILPLQKALTRLEAIWPGLLPAGVLADLIHLKPAFLERFVYQWNRLASHRPTFGMLLLWLTIPGLKRRLEIAFKDTFPSPAYMRRRYQDFPFHFWPLAYALRFLHSLQFLVKSSGWADG
jgi:hypothetical protein